jgi:membrane protein required for colicin V production
VNWLDYLILLALGWGAFRGGMKGFAVAITSLIALYVAVILGFKGMHAVTTWLQQQFDWNTPWMPFLGFLTVFIAVFAGILLLGRSFDRLFKAAALGWANRLAGAVFGAFQMLLVAGTLLWLVDQVQLIEPEVKHSSKLYPFVSDTARASWTFLSKLSPALGDWMARIDAQFDALITPQP